MIITIDGPAGTGKSTVAHRLARRLELDFLDTGAMYRALTLVVLEAGVDPRDAAAVEAAVADAALTIDFTRDPPRVLLAGRVVDEDIRSARVTSSVSTVASHSAVRWAMVGAQRAIAAGHPQLVTEGRDQGSFVFPAADVKFYLDASVEIRAQRRAEQLRAKGERVDIGALRRAIEERDESDRSRSMGALVCPPGAIVVDTGGMSVAEVVDHLAELAERGGRAAARERLRRVAAAVGGQPPDGRERRVATPECDGATA